MSADTDNQADGDLPDQLDEITLEVRLEQTPDDEFQELIKPFVEALEAREENVTEYQLRSYFTGVLDQARRAPPGEE